VALRAWLCLAVLMGGALAGCERGGEPAAMILRPVEAPAGGVVYALCALEGTQGVVWVALTRRSLFVRRQDEARWRPIKSVWPDVLGRPSASVAEALTEPSQSSAEPPAARFVGWRGALWALLRPSPGAGLTLMVSRDEGVTWAQVALPAGGDMGSLRLEPRGEQGLYLVSSRGLWALDEAGGWREVGLDGVVHKRAGVGPLKPRLRHYLPPTQTRPWALLTVLGERLQVYRRDEAGGSWRQTGELPTVDHQLEVSQSGVLYVLAADGLWTSADGATWTQREAPAGVSLGERYERLVVRGEAVVVGTSSGALWTSVDGGRSWTLARAPDPDQRGITALEASERGELWAATHGQGALRSTDNGASWSPQVEGLSAAGPLTMEVDGAGRLWVGTWSGLWELGGGPTQPQWRLRHSRATSALLVRGDGLVVSGTTGGALLRGAAGEAEEWIWRKRGMHYEPARTQGLELPGEAVVEILERPGSGELFAVSRGYGVAVSSDGGAGWAVRPVNDAFADALADSELTSFALASQGFMAVTAKALSQRSVEQLWVTESDGESWRAANTLTAQGTDPLRLFAPAGEAPGTLLLAQGMRLALSRDHGVTWRELRGPWGTMPIATMSLQGGRGMMVTRSQLRLALHLFDPLEGEAPSVQSYPLIWSYTAGEQREAVLDARLVGQLLYVRTPTQLLWATLPARGGSLPNAPVMMFTFTVLTVLSAAAFVAIRYERRRRRGGFIG
jgi:hypothetical protein